MNANPTDGVYSSLPVISSANETDRHDITEILLKVALNTITMGIWYYFELSRQ